VSQARRLLTREGVLQEILRGNQCAILVEGEAHTDAALLKSILRNVASQVTLFGRDGRNNVLADLRELMGQVPREGLFAILDRDFESDARVEQGYAPDYSGHVFFWRRFTIENYFLEPLWIMEAVHELCWRDVESIPVSLKTEIAAQDYLLIWARRLLPQSAGNATIIELHRECSNRGIRFQGRSYFEELTERDPESVRTELVTHYSGGAPRAPDLLSAEAIARHYAEKLNALQSIVQALPAAHAITSGKLLLRAVYQELPGSSKPNMEYLKGKLVTFASKSIPDDLQTLVIEHILPRWRRAREEQPQ